MTFATTKTADVAETLVHFGEGSTYWPACGAGSQRSITIVVDEQDFQQTKDGKSLLEVSQINVFARNHATTGIDDPRLGDRLIRDSDTPAAAGQKVREYYLSRVIDVDPDGGWYEFISRRRIETGPNVSGQDSFAG